MDDNTNHQMPKLIELLFFKTLNGVCNNIEDIADLLHNEQHLDMQALTRATNRIYAAYTSQFHMTEFLEVLGEKP